MSKKKKYSEYSLELNNDNNEYRNIKIEYNDTDYISFLINNGKRLKIEIRKCPGCFPVYQFNQLGHVGCYGCLGDYFD